MEYASFTFRHMSPNFKCHSPLGTPNWTKFKKDREFDNKNLLDAEDTTMDTRLRENYLKATIKN